MQVSHELLGTIKGANAELEMLRAQLVTVSVICFFSILSKKSCSGFRSAIVGEDFGTNEDDRIRTISRRANLIELEEPRSCGW